MIENKEEKNIIESPSLSIERKTQNSLRVRKIVPSQLADNKQSTFTLPEYFQAGGNSNKSGVSNIIQASMGMNSHSCSPNMRGREQEIKGREESCVVAPRYKKNSSIYEIPQILNKKYIVTTSMLDEIKSGSISDSPEMVLMNKINNLLSRTTMKGVASTTSGTNTYTSFPSRMQSGVGNNASGKMVNSRSPLFVRMNNRIFHNEKLQGVDQGNNQNQNANIRNHISIKEQGISPREERELRFTKESLERCSREYEEYLSLPKSKERDQNLNNLRKLMLQDKITAIANWERINNNMGKLKGITVPWGNKGEAIPEAGRTPEETGESEIMEYRERANSDHVHAAKRRVDMHMRKTPGGHRGNSLHRKGGPRGALARINNTFHQTITHGCNSRRTPLLNARTPLTLHNTDIPSNQNDHIHHIHSPASPGFKLKIFKTDEKRIDSLSPEYTDSPQQRTRAGTVASISSYRTSAAIRLRKATGCETDESNQGNMKEMMRVLEEKEIGELRNSGKEFQPRTTTVSPQKPMEKKPRWITFIEDGISLEGVTANIRLNIQLIMDKYNIPPPELLSPKTNLDSALEGVSTEGLQYISVKQQRAYDKLERRGRKEILDVCSKSLSNYERKFKHIFLLSGLEIEKLQDIPLDCQVLVVGEARACIGLQGMGEERPDIVREVASHFFELPALSKTPKVTPHPPSPKPNIGAPPPHGHKGRTVCGKEEQRKTATRERGKTAFVPERGGGMRSYQRKPTRGIQGGIQGGIQSPGGRTYTNYANDNYRSQAPHGPHPVPTSTRKKYILLEQELSISPQKILNKTFDGSLVDKNGLIDMGSTNVREDKLIHTPHAPVSPESPSIGIGRVKVRENRRAPPGTAAAGELRVGESGRLVGYWEGKEVFVTGERKKEHNSIMEGMDIEKERSQSMEKERPERPERAHTVLNHKLQLHSPPILHKFIKNPTLNKPTFHAITKNNARNNTLRAYQTETAFLDNYSPVSKRRKMKKEEIEAIEELQDLKYIEDMHSIKENYQLTVPQILQLKSEFMTLKCLEWEKDNPGKAVPEELEDVLAYSRQSVKFEIISKYTKMFKDKHIDVIKRMLNIRGLDTDTRYTQIGWLDFLHYSSLLTYCTAKLHEYAYFWTRLMDPDNLGKISEEDFLDIFEKLARGLYNNEKTIVSQTYAERIQKLFSKSGCFDEEQMLIISKVKENIIDQVIEVNKLNQILKYDL